MSQFWFWNCLVLMSTTDKKFHFLINSFTPLVPDWIGSAPNPPFPNLSTPVLFCGMKYELMSSFYADMSVCQCFHSCSQRQLAGSTWTWQIESTQMWTNFLRHFSTFLILNFWMPFEILTCVLEYPHSGSFSSV